MVNIKDFQINSLRSQYNIKYPAGSGCQMHQGRQKGVKIRKELGKTSAKKKRLNSGIAWKWGGVTHARIFSHRFLLK